MSQFLFSCVQNPNKAPEEPFFDTQAFIEAQHTLLAEKKCSISKKVSLGDKVETTHITPADSLSWAEELGFLNDLHLSAAALSSSYTKEVTGHTCTYELKEEDDDRSNVKKLVIELSESNQLKRLSAEVTNAMELYNSNSFIYLTTKELDNQVLIDTYGLQATQKVVLADEVAYTVDAKVQE